MIPWSITNIAGIPMEDYCKEQDHADIDKDEIITEVRKAGSEVIKRKGATFYAIAMSVNKICDTILRDSNNIMTVSTYLDGTYGIKDVCLSIPCVIGANGIEREVPPALTDDEKEKLTASLVGQATFLSMSRGSVLYGESELIRDGRQNCFYQIRVYDDLGVDIATVSFTGVHIARFKR
jgi:hypothetical protein